MNQETRSNPLATSWLAPAAFIRTGERSNFQDVARASTGLSGVIADQGTNPSKSSHWTELCRVPTAALAAQLIHLKKRDVSAQDLRLSRKMFV